MRRLCVFCGASPGRGAHYVDLARSVGAGLAGRGIGVVYGGGRVGLMGALADGALAALLARFEGWSAPAARWSEPPLP